MEHIWRRKTAAWGIVAVLLALMALPPAVQAAGRMRGGQGGNMDNLVSSMPLEELSAKEKAGLVLMVQEEKLARDVYQALFSKWNLRIFGNIGRSEQTHMDAVRSILAKYSLDDPTQGLAPGEFADPKLRDLYQELTAKGSASLTAALEVGAMIEDLDIRDLEEELAGADNRDIRVVYQNLMKGSRNHMRSFSGQLKRAGVDYKARFISADLLRQILSSPQERGVLDENGRLM